jgi:hypothetical protein
MAGYVDISHCPLFLLENTFIGLLIVGNAYYINRTLIVHHPPILSLRSPHGLINRYQASIAKPLIHMKPNARTAPIAAARTHHKAAFLFMKLTTHFFVAPTLVNGFL